jgi:hypothetical protein
MEITRMITIQMLETAFSEIIKKLKFYGASQIELTDNLYRLIPTDEWQSFNDDNIVTGSLFDDFDSLKNAVSKEDPSFAFVDFDRTASLLRYISEKLNPVNG